MSVLFTRRGKAPPVVQYVEYIRSGGSQYIDTEFKANNNTRVVIDFEYISGDVVFGAYNTNGAGGFGIQQGSNKWYYYYGSASAYTNTAVSANTRMQMDCNKNQVYLNGTLIHAAASNVFQGVNNLLLFGLQNAGAPGYYTVLKLYSCQIYDNGTPVRDYSPCIDPEGVACLYDKVSKTYFYNKGTGVFYAPVNSPDIDVGTVYTYTASSEFIVPSDGTYSVEIHGGGGGGGGSHYWWDDGTSAKGGGGGGSGEVYSLLLTKGDVYAITVGSGGAGGNGGYTSGPDNYTSSGQGKTGGTSSFGTYACAGGIGGQGIVYNTSPPGGAKGSLAIAGSGTAGGYGNKNKPSQTYGNGGAGAASAGRYGTAGSAGKPGAVIITFLG